MRIAHVIPALTKGGAERVVVELANASVERGHQVTIIAAVSAPPHLIANRLRPEVELVYIGTRSVRATYLLLLPWLRRNRRWLFEQDIVHCHLTFASVLGFVLQKMRLLSRKSVPVVVETYHAVGMAIPKVNRALHALLLSGRDAVALMAEDPYWRRFAARHPSMVIRTIPNGIAPLHPVSSEVLERYRSEQTAIPAQHRAVIGTVGRLMRDRRPEMLFECFADVVRETGKGVHILIGGEGPERSRLQALARERRISGQVHMLGLVLDPAEPIGLMDLFVTVNVGQITGIAALEAAFLGVPVVALQLVDDYRPAPDDWIWSSPDPGELASKIVELLDDRSRLRDLALQQQALARARFSIEAMAQAYDQLYRAALTRRKREG